MLSLSFRIFLSNRSDSKVGWSEVKLPVFFQRDCNSEGCERETEIDWEFIPNFPVAFWIASFQRGIIPNPSWKGDIGKCFPPIRAEFDQLIFQCCIDVIPRKTHIDNSVQSNNILGIWIQKDWLAELRCEIFWFVSPSLDGKG